MMRILSRVAAIAALTAGVSAQAPAAATVAEFAGTWNIELMSHQFALVIEPQEGNKVTATMMMMGTDIPLKGELVGRTLTLIGYKPEGAPDGHAPPKGAQPITATLQEDGTLTGEMMTTKGPAKWTAEKLRARKPQG